MSFCFAGMIGFDAKKAPCNCDICKGYGGGMINTVFGYELLLSHVIEFVT